MAHRRPSRPRHALSLTKRHGEALAELIGRGHSLFSPAEAAVLLRRYDWPGEPFRPDAPTQAMILKALLADATLMTRAPGHGPRGEPLYVSTATAAAEIALFDAAQALSSQPEPLIDGSAMPAAIAHLRAMRKAEGKPDNADLEAALAKLLGPGELQLLDGPPGAGKSSLAVALIDAYRHGPRGQAGVVIASSSDRAAAALGHQAGCPSRQVSALNAEIARGIAPVDPGGLIVVDEAGMVPTHELSQLAAHCATHQLRLVLIGDRLQMPPEAGGDGVFRALLERYPAAILKESFRQRDPDDRAALAALRQGDGVAAAANFSGRGRIELVKNAEAVIQEAAAAYFKWAAAPKNAGERGLVLCPDRETAVELNRRIAGLRKGAHGALKSADGLGLMVGDRVILQQPAPVEGGGPMARRGLVGTVTAVDDQGGLSLRPDGGGGTELRFPAHSDEFFSHAWALHLRAAQGAKVERAFVAIDRRITAPEAMVALSRHKRKITLIVSRDAYASVRELGEAMTRRAHRPLYIETLRPVAG